MADFTEVDGYAAPEAMPGAVAVLLGWFGALMSVALIVGLGLWGYQLAVRDVTGVPVVRALEGPMRVAPEDPGGTQAAHQGLAVNSVAADGAAERPADRLILAPAPLDLNDEDLPRPDLSGVRDTVLAEAPTETPPETELTSRETLLALAETLTEGVAPLELSPIEPGEAPETLVDAPVEAPASPFLPPDVSGVSRSVLPLPRPVGDVTAMAVATEVALAVSRPSGEVSPERIPAGTRLVQFGAYDSPELARSAWEDLVGRFGDFLQDKQRIVQEATSGGRTFYRLRAMGFVDINDARRFCAAILAERQACIPVVVR